MGKFVDLTGKRFGRLTVIERSPSIKLGVTRWLCKCDCGNLTVTTTGRLRNGTCRSCGCLHIESARKQGHACAKHHKTNCRLYRAWSNMKTRCYNKANKSYERWGGRGIYVCDEWLHDFEAFYNWAMSSGYDKHKTLDRIDNDGPYCPSNCRWATPKEQARNTRKNRHITYDGETHTLAEWSEILGVSPSTLCYRLKHYPVEISFTMSVVVGGNEIKRFHVS